MNDIGLEAAFEGMLREYEYTGDIRVTDWIRQFPAHAGTLIDFASVLKVSGDVNTAGQVTGPWPDEGGAVAKALERHRQDELHTEVRLGKRLAAARSQAASARGAKGRRKFRQAAVYAWTFDVLRGGAKRLEAYTVGKSAYLLEQSLRLELFEDHQQMAYGPYDPRLKYGSPRTIAANRRWFTAVNNYADLEVGENIDEVWKYAPKYVGDEDVARSFLRYIAELSFEELEVLTTVLWTVKQQGEPGTSVDAQNVLDWLREHWREKTTRAHFNSKSISSAIRRLERFGMLSSG